MPSLFTNRWGISSEANTEDELHQSEIQQQQQSSSQQSQRHHQQQSQQPEDESKRAKKKSKKSKKRKHEELDHHHHQQQQQQQQQQPQLQPQQHQHHDIDAAVMNLVGGELSADKKGATYNQNDMFYNNEQHHWQSYINEEPANDELDNNLFAAQQAQRQAMNRNEQPDLSSSAAKKRKKRKTKQQQVLEQHNEASVSANQMNKDQSQHRQLQEQQQQQQKKHPAPHDEPHSKPQHVGSMRQPNRQKPTAAENLDRKRNETDNTLIQEAIREASEVVRSLEVVVTEPTTTTATTAAAATDGMASPSLAASAGPAEQISATEGKTAESQSVSAPHVSKPSEPHDQQAKKAAVKKVETTSLTPPSVVAPKVRRPAPPKKDAKRASWTGDGSEKGGSFTPEEKINLDAFMKQYRDDNYLTEDELKARVWASERKKDNFWDLVSQVLPNRTRASVYKHVRRAYHVFEVRAKWTEEEEKELDRLYQEKGAQWKIIGKVMGRMPEDCRDRWRNYVKCGNNRQQNKWSPDEETLLKNIVNEMMAEDPNGSVNWTAVSEKMDGKRSRIQCRYKWNKLQKKIGLIKIDLMLPGDHLAIVDYLKNSGVTKEEEVEWEQLGSLEGKGIWTPPDFRDAFVRLKEQVSNYSEKSFLEIVDELHKQLKALPESKQTARFKHNGTVLDTSGMKLNDVKGDSKDKPTATPNQTKDGYIESWKLK